MLSTEMTADELHERDERTINDLLDMITEDYRAVMDSPHFNRDQKIGYIAAACNVDPRRHLGWMCNETAVRLISAAFNRAGIQ